MAKSICTVDGCAYGAKMRGLCNRHYDSLRRGDTDALRPLLRANEPAAAVSCGANDCDRAQYAHGYCYAHHQRVKRGQSVNAPMRRRASKYSSDDVCRIDACGRAVRARGLCSAHHQRVLRGKNVTTPIKTGSGSWCTEDGCDRPVKGRGLCASHYARLAKGYTTTRPIGDRGRVSKADLLDPGTWSRSVTKQGYVILHHAVGGGARIAEHRWVMETYLGRALVHGENVHHINGDRADNRIENLELWNTSQPSGQRIPDKVAWAIELLQRYRPDALAN